MTKTMFVSVGTDHHPFERLIAWSERFAERTEGEWNVQIQHGRTRKPTAGHGFDFCGHDRLQELFATADVVVSHGGPATITEARRLGHTPIVVARDPARGEHVDNHQQLFVARLAKGGLIDAVADEDAFLAAIVTYSYLPREQEASTEVPPGVYAVGTVIERLVRQRRGGGAHAGHGRLAPSRH